MLTREQQMNLATMVGRRTNIPCPRCGAIMVIRQNKAEQTFFLGCNTFPNCKGTREIEERMYFEINKKKSPVDLAKYRSNAIQKARYILSCPYFILDTETTGLLNAEICQLAVLKSDGNKYITLVKPTKLIENGAIDVHGINNDTVAHAPPIYEVIQEIPASGLMVIYNAPFDIKMIKQSMAAHNRNWEAPAPNMIFDMMQIYAEFYGRWDEQYNSFRWQKLETAIQQCNISSDLEFHNALSDCIMTDRLLRFIANQEVGEK